MLKTLISKEISMRTIKFLFYLTMQSLLLLLFIGCSIAPLTSPKTAGTLGAGNWEISTGFAPAPSLSVSRGFAKDFDSGIIIENQIFPLIALWGKYALKNSENKNYAFSFYGGVFHALDPADSKGFFIGPVVSYKYDHTELFLSAQYNWVHWDSVEMSLSLSDKKNSIFNDIKWKQEKETLSYMQYSLGMSFWFTDKFALSLACKLLQVVDGSEHGLKAYPSAELIFRF